MRWPFWKSKASRDSLFDLIDLEVPVAVQPPKTAPTRPEPERPRGSLGNPWAPEAPEEWLNPKDAAEFERQNRECHEQARTYRASEHWPPCGISGKAHVFPRVGARKCDLVALAEALEAWRVRHASDVVGVFGLEPMRQGDYPEMEIYMGFINSRTEYAPGWEICPVQISTQGGLFELATLIACLEDELPRELFSHIGTLMPD